MPPKPSVWNTLAATTAIRRRNEKGDEHENKGRDAKPAENFRREFASRGDRCGGSGHV